MTRRWTLGRVAPRALVLASTLMLASCQPSFAIELASAGERLPSPAFVVRDADDPDAVLEVGTIDVRAADDPRDKSGELVWSTRHPSEQRGFTGFTYGVTPDGWDTVVGPEPLQPGHSYRVEVGGVGAGTLVFRVEADGAVRPD